MVLARLAARARAEIVAAAALVALAAPARAAEIGIGAFGGVSIPVVNEASEQGTQFGVRIPVQLVPIVTVEPFFAKSSLGEGEVDAGGFSYTRDGGEVTGLGVNVLFAFGAPLPLLKLFPFAGVGRYTIEREAAEEIREAGYTLGLGVGLAPVPKLSLSLRAELVVIPTGETSQKLANITAGVAYHLISVP